jgi:phosphatidylserine/phosphatidylglycerophosphate/cardiolipin synthase-like enzyme
MVISSGAILGALIDAIDRGVTLSGVYDGPEMKVVLADWAKGGKSAGKATQWAKIKTKLVPKWSIPYTPSGPHNFMHNKLAAVDGKLAVTGSFNFSQNATHNAENLLTLRDPVLVSQYSKYVDQLVATYTGDRPARAALQKTRKAKTGRKTGRR